MDKVRLNKFISDSGYCSRRDADTYIKQGRVTVNGLDCNDLSTWVATTDKVSVDGEPIKIRQNLIYIALNKPVGITCTTDLNDSSNVIDFVGHKERLFPIGRLDKLSQGLIFLTNDGNIVNKILRAGNAHQKEYIVDVDRPFSDQFISKMEGGVRLDAQTRTRPCKVQREGSSSFRITLVQGLNRQIRRMCEVCGYDVKKLQRVRIINISLRGIAEGSWRYLTSDEVLEIRGIIGNSVGTEQASVAPKRAYIRSAGRGFPSESFSAGAKVEGAAGGRTGKPAVGSGKSSGRPAVGSGKSSGRPAVGSGKSSGRPAVGSGKTSGRPAVGSGKSSGRGRQTTKR